jgi:hypothetical protein
MPLPKVTKAVVGYVHPDYVRAEFMVSMLGLQRRTRTAIDGFEPIHSGPNIARARNALTRAFLATNAEWLLTVDTDMVFAPDVLDRLIAAADPVLRPVMGAFCLMQETLDGEGLPTLYEVAEGVNGLGFARYTEWPDDAVIRVGATGTGCLLVHRGVFEILDADERTHDDVWPWFREASLHGRPIGEDFTFMLRCGVAGIPIHVHTGVRVGHIKSTMMGKVA